MKGIHRTHIHPARIVSALALFGLILAFGLLAGCGATTSDVADTGATTTGPSQGADTTAPAEAAAPALSSYERIYWIAGGLPKEGGIASLSPLFSRIAKAYLIGEAASAFASTLGNAVPYEISGTMEKAVAHAAADAAMENNPVAVMLSPACASFDQYKNFEVRGDAFVGHVAALDGVTMLVDVPKGGN